MNESWETRDESSQGSNAFGYFALGAMVGIGVAMLMAPDSGRRTQGLLTAAAQRSSRLVTDAFGQARETVSKIGGDVVEAVRVGRQTYDDVRGAR